MENTCNHCGFTISPNFYFCPNCGKKLKSPPPSTSISKQAYIYAISILLPPLGLIPAVKYLLNKNSKAKIIGVVAVILTIISLVITWQIFQSLLGNLTNSTNQLQNLGY